MKKPLREAVTAAEEAAAKAPDLFGVPSGVSGLDEMFFTTKFESGRARKVPLGGYPCKAIINLTGSPDTGKSLMAEQFAVRQASLGYGTCFVTVESPAPFVVTGMKQRAAAMGIAWKDIRQRIVMIDAASHPQLRDDLESLLATLEYAFEQYKTPNVVVDSITGLYEAREVMARQIVRTVFDFLKRHGKTALLVSQKRSGHEEQSAEAAGGYAVGHICDSTIVVAKKLVTTKWEEERFAVPIGGIFRTIRIDGCRLCGHDTSTHLLEITEAGLVQVGPSLTELAGRR